MDKRMASVIRALDQEIKASERALTSASILSTDASYSLGEIRALRFAIERIRVAISDD